MAVVIALLRGVNVGGHNLISMDDLRSICLKLKFEEPRTLLQSGNVVFRTTERNLDQLARRMEDAIEKAAGFRTAVILRMPRDLKAVLAQNPFEGRSGINPSSVLVVFLSRKPAAEARAKLLAIQPETEELHIGEREFYMYFPNGMALPKLSWTAVEKVAGTPGTGRNWNTVIKLLEISEGMENAK